MTTIDKHAQGWISWVDLMTSDPADARRFYGSLFDWTFEMGPPESGPYTICFKAGKRIAGVGPKPPDAPYPTAWTPYLATDDVDATCARIREAGGTVNMGPIDVFEEGRMAIVADPTGGVFGLWQARRHSGAQLIDEPGTLNWAELNTRDLERAKTFFVAVFGYEPHNMDGLPYVTLHFGDKTVGGILQMTEQWPAEVPAHWMSYFGSADPDATIAAATKLGGKQCVPPFDTPYGRIAVLEDPQGGFFSIVRPTKLAK